MNQTKICTKCGTEKDLSNFVKSKLGKYGKSSQCKSCDKLRRSQHRVEYSEYAKQYRQANSQSIAESKKQWAIKNKDRVATKKKTWVEQNRDYVKNKAKMYHDKHRERRLLQLKEYRDKNKSRIAEWKKQWVARNQDHVVTQSKLYRELHREQILQNHKIYRESNRASVSLRKKIWAQNNPIKASRIAKRYKQTQKGKNAAIKGNNTRRARLAKVEGTYSVKYIDMLFENQLGKCVYCETKLITAGRDKYHIDHIFPISKGGSNWPENLQLLCKKCNLSKGSKLPEVFCVEIGLLF